MKRCRSLAVWALVSCVPGCGSYGAGDIHTARSHASRDPGPATVVEVAAEAPSGTAWRASRLAAEPVVRGALRPPEPAGPEPAVVFGAVADVQYCDCAAWGRRNYRGSLWKLGATMRALGRFRVHFTIQLGDLIETDYVSYASILHRFEVGAAGDLYHVVGNHDWAVDAGDRARVLPTLGLAGSTYYSFGRSGWRFIVMDGTELSTYATAPGSPERAAARTMLRELRARGAPHAQVHNGGVSAGQLAWLERELSLAEALGERAIVFCHFPVYPPDSGHILWNAEAVRAILEAHPGVGVTHVSGHDHAGGYHRHAGIHYLTLRGMVESAEQCAFAVFRLHQDRIDVHGYGRQPSHTLRLSAFQPG